MTVLAVGWRCPRCQQHKPVEEWPKRNAPGRPAYCKSCQRDWAREYREANREMIRAAARKQRAERMARDQAGESWREWKNSLKYRFGITVEQYEALAEAQSGLCGICAKPPKEDRRLAVDHDHRCCPGKFPCGRCIRGLLCSSCNPKLGFYELYESEIAAWRDRRAFNR